MKSNYRGRFASAGYLVLLLVGDGAILFAADEQAAPQKHSAVAVDQGTEKGVQPPASALEVLESNRVSCTKLPPGNIWAINLSFGRANEETLAALSDLLKSDLGWVVLTHNKLRKHDLKLLAKAQGIFDLNLSDTEIDDEDLAEISTLKMIANLSLQRTSITDGGLKHLRRLTELQRLELDGTKIAGAGLSNLESLPKLQHLRVSGTQVGDNECQQIGKLTSLRTLDISNTRISDRGLESLAQLHHLQKITAQMSKISDEGATKFKARHAELRAEAIKNGKIENSSAPPVIVGLH